MVALGNPVQGHIYAHTETPPLGAFWVTAAFGQIDSYHLPPLGHQGIDIGNGTCGFDLLAVEDGDVTAAFRDSGNGALIARYRLTKYPYLEPAIAHMPSLEVVVGQHVARGQRIGACGMSGASACHLHGGMKQLINGVWVEIDWWPLLAQNQGSEMPGFKIGTNIGTFKMVGSHALISPSDPKVRYMQKPDAGPWDVAASLDLKTPDSKPVDIDGNSPPLNNRDQVYLVDAPTFGVAAYALRQDGVFTPKVADTTAAFNAGVDAAAAQAQTAKK